MPDRRLSYSDLAFFSGFVAGDGSFVIRANNAGASWCCGLAIRLRADNTPLLASFRRWSGVGELSRVPARGAARPQAEWIVVRKRDCARIAAILDARPPLGKAAGAFRIWRRAVEVWNAQGGGSTALGDLAAELRELRRARPPGSCPVHINPDDLASFLAGFASAEAGFGATAAGSASFAINLRADDGPLLQLFHDVFDLGHLRQVPPIGTSQAAVSWRTGRLRDLRRLVDIFDAHPLRGRAADVYSAWRELVVLEPRPAIPRRALAAEVQRQRRFIPGLDSIERISVAERRRRRCAEALKSWSQSDDYPGSAGDYERWRRSTASGAPTRNTVAAAYGSWRSALVAVGLGTDASLSVERVAAIRAGNSRGSAARRAASRTTIIAAVQRCIAEIGHEPRALEFLRWRLVRAPDCPCQMTIYRLFPGGFAEVLACVRAAGNRAAAA